MAARKQKGPGAGTDASNSGARAGKDSKSGAAQAGPGPAIAPAAVGKEKALGKARGKVASPAATELRSKLVRDSFTMPEEDYALIEQLKARAIDCKRPAKKSELLRAGLQALAQLPDRKLLAALQVLRPLPTGRPKKKR